MTVCGVGRKFGSCHSFGVAVGLCGYGMCQMRGDFRSTIFLKMRRVGCINFSLSHISFFQSPSCLRSRSLVPVGNLCLENCQPFFLKTNLSRPYGWQRFAAWRSGGIFSTTAQSKPISSNFSNSFHTKNVSPPDAKPLLSAALLSWS